jgi:hypothetical protein
MLNEFWSLRSPTLPTRSRLYSLAPMGIGSAQVESVTSYMMRLAEAHAVTPGALIRMEIFPRLPASPKRLSCAALHSLNGLSRCFALWVSILESLTARNDLHTLTLLPWQGVFASDGVSRRYRAWCPRCYEERRLHEDVVYDSLLGTLASVSVCTRHEISLEEFCPYCEKRSIQLSARARPGFCVHCNRWLGIALPLPQLDAPEQDMTSRLQVARAVGDLISMGATESQIQSDHVHLRPNIQWAISDLTHGNRLFSPSQANIRLVNWSCPSSRNEIHL